MKDELAQKRIMEASELARAGELKGGQELLKEALWLFEALSLSNMSIYIAYK